jgi:helix-turn-helix protein
MGRPAMKLTETGAIADFIRDASVRLGIPQERLKTAVKVSQELSREELEVVTSLAEYARGGTSMSRRSALSRGIKSAIETFPKTEEEDDDPLADVDDPMSPEEAATAVALAEAKSQINRQRILKGSLSAAEAAKLIGRSRQTLERLRRDGRLLALREGNQWRYPPWQFEPDAPGGVLPGLEEILRNLHLSPAGAAFWLLKPAERLGGVTPIELLRQHRPEPAIQLAWDQSWMP